MTRLLPGTARCGRDSWLDKLKLTPEQLQEMMSEVQGINLDTESVTSALRAMRQLPGVQAATVFGQSMHLLVDESMTPEKINNRLREVGITHADIHEIGPSLEDVFVTLSEQHGRKQKQAA